MKSKSTKKALIGSTVSLLLSCVMLLGTTFAWFSDNSTNRNNRIESGNLEIDFLMDKKGTGKYVSIAGETGDIFAEANDGNPVGWEPDKTEMVYLAVKNTGTLALKYNINLVVVDAGLVDALEYVIIDGGTEDNITAKDWSSLSSRTDVKKGKVKAGEFTVKEDGRLYRKGDTDYFAVAVHMLKDANPKFQTKKASVDINISATQAAYEKDSFSKGYDEIAKLMKTADSITVTPSNLSNTDFTKDNALYKFKGRFDDLTIQTNKGFNQVFDGSGITGNCTVTLKAPGTLSDYKDLSGDKKGNYTLTGFNAEQLIVYAYDTTVNIIDNTAKFIYVNGANIDLNISGNKVNSASQTNTITNDCGIYLNITDYDLSFTDNTVTNTLAHAVSINGRQAESEEFKAAGKDNVISSFSGNKITVNSGVNAAQAALSITNCKKYADIDCAEQTMSDAATELVNMLKDSTNTYTLSEGQMYFMFGDFKVETLEQ